MYAVLDAVKKGQDLSDPREQALAALLRGEACPLDSVRRTMEIYDSVHKREVIEGLLLSGCTVEEVEKTVKVPKNVTETYVYLFFDVDVFEDDLDRIAYAEEYTLTSYGSDIKKYAIRVGKNALMVRFSRGNYVIPPADAHSSVRNVAYMFSQLAKANPMQSDVAREAHRWAQLCMKSAENAPDANAGDPVLDLHIQIKAVDSVKNAESTDIQPDDISRGK